MVRRVAVVSEVELEQGLLECLLQALALGPVKEAMRIKRVVDASGARHRHLEAGLGGTIPDHDTVRCGLSFGRSIFLHDMLVEILPLRCHRWVELERAENDLGIDSVRGTREAFLETPKPNDAPRAG